MENTLAMVVASCDKYRSVWGPQFALLSKFYRPLPEKIYLLTEMQPISDEERTVLLNGNVTVIHSPEKTWSKRIIDGLRMVDAEYVLFWLDDFFLQSKADTGKIQKILEWMSQDTRISAVRLYPFWEKESLSWPKYKEEFFVIDRNYDERINAQATIWRKERLIALLQAEESAWAFEIMASNRSRRDDFLYLGYHDMGFEKRILPYEFAAAAGYGITVGKWLWNNQKLFDDNGVKCNMHILGVIGQQEWNALSKSRVNRIKKKIQKILDTLRRSIKSQGKSPVKIIRALLNARTRFQLLNKAEYLTYTQMDLKNLEK